jgi:hypothetical protein
VVTRLGSTKTRPFELRRWDTQLVPSAVARRGRCRTSDRASFGLEHLLLPPCRRAVASTSQLDTKRLYSDIMRIARIPTATQMVAQQANHRSRPSTTLALSHLGHGEYELGRAITASNTSTISSARRATGSKSAGAGRGAHNPRADSRRRR